MSKHHPVKIVVTHPDAIISAVAAAKAVGIPESAVVLLGKPTPEASDEAKSLARGFKTIDDLVDSFSGHPVPVSARLSPGGSRKKLAFL